MHFESSILALMKALCNSSHSVTSVGVSGHIFVHRLHTNLKSGAAIAQHVREVPLEAIVRSGLDRDPDALRLAPLAVLHCLGHGIAAVARQGVVEVPDEVVSILLRQCHEGAAHHDEFNLQPSEVKKRLGVWSISQPCPRYDLAVSAVPLCGVFADMGHTWRAPIVNQVD